MLMSDVGSSAGSSSDETEVPDGLVEALKDLPVVEMNAALAAHGLPIEADHEANVTALARAMVA